MTPIVAMVMGSIGSALAAVGVFGLDRALEILTGMFGPLVAATASLALTEQTFRRDPERVTALMLKAFAGKVVFFGLYVTGALKVLAVRPTPFVVSFTSYFVGLYFVEALCLRRMFAGSTHAAPRG